MKSALSKAAYGIIYRQRKKNFRILTHRRTVEVTLNSTIPQPILRLRDEFGFILQSTIKI